jgi:hypothetical protein
MRSAAAAAALGFGLLGGPARATLVEFVSLDTSILLSDLIVTGEVTAVEPSLDASGDIVTRVRLRVKETLKGAAAVGEILEIEAWGGRFGDREMEVVGEARYAVGDGVLLQLEWIEDAWHTLGLSYGKWSLERDEGGPGVWIERDLSGLEPSADLSAGSAASGAAGTPALRITLEAMRAAVASSALRP